MSLVTTIHLHNVPEGKSQDYAGWFDGDHASQLTALRGFRSAQRFEVTEEQVMAGNPQPWRFMSLYDFDLPDPAIDLPALGPLIAVARDAGLIADDGTERIYSFDMFADWEGSANWRKDQPFSGVSIILGNYTPGRYDEYHHWYDKIHSIEVTNVPGHVAMKRGELSALQIEPRRYCPGDQLVLAAQQTDDLAFTIKDFIDRALGASPSGVAMEPRSSAASTARTVHYFRKISGKDAWPGGIAYAGDMSVYPGKA
ncbi:hypothetical protein LK12_22950 [Novosphingobium malaysiense]|uniref:EthD domain-containing protein n=2 Tax=Novosphingobium malaysiense TaxID=1348853 RepID=A0A0B1ZD78_9SPHN|nr:hypothetical protein LK12_22950 [Novosphingobium malaysiense]